MVACFVTSGCKEDGSATESEIAFFFTLFVLWVSHICLAIYVANEKHRSTGEGATLAALFGPFGVLILALLPTKKRRKVLAKKKPNEGNAPMRVVVSKIDAVGRYPFECPACFNQRKASPAAIGKTIPCVDCGQPIEIILHVDRKPSPLKPVDAIVRQGLKNYKYGLQCPLCSADFLVPFAKMGSVAKCPGCKEQIRLPSEEEASAK